MTSPLAATLAQAAGRNSELLSTLEQTNYAPTTLAQCQSYIKDLHTKIASTDAELKKLHRITEDERKDHLKYRDSTVKRLAYKLGGHKGQAKFASKTEKEEREFLEAWQREREAQVRRDQDAQSLSVAESDRPGLEADANRHAAAQRDLDALYETIFQGPTPEVPGEDGRESEVRAAQDHAAGAQRALWQARQAFEALAHADAALDRAGQDMSDALSHSTWDMYGGGTFNDMMEREALSRAQAHLTEATRHLGDARANEPAIRPLADVRIDQGHVLSDVLFDNIFSDMRQHDRIEAANADLKRAVQQLHAQLMEQRGRLDAAQAGSASADQAVAAARAALQEIRAEAFRNFASGSA